MSAVIRLKKKTAANFVRRQLLRRMKSGYFKENVLPSEEGVANMFGVSRITVRDALAILENQRYITRTQGKETKINTAVCEIESRISEGLLFTETIRSYGYEPTMSSCDIEKRPTRPRIREKLASEAEEMYRIEKVFCGDGDPMIYSVNYLTTDFVDDRIMDCPLEDTIIFKYLHEEFDFPAIAYDKIFIKPMVADENVASKLNIEEGTPMIRIESVAIDYQERPLLINYEYYHPTKIRFQEIRAIDYQMED